MWRPIEEVIPKDDSGTDRMLLRDQYGNVVIGAWRPYGGPWMIEGGRVAMGAKFESYMRLPR